MNIPHTNQGSRLPLSVNLSCLFFSASSIAILVLTTCGSTRAQIIPDATLPNPQ